MKKKNGYTISSGAEKVENISHGENGQNKAEFERKAAENRVEAAKAKADAKAAATKKKEEHLLAKAQRREAKAQAFEREIAAIEKERKDKKEQRKKKSGRPDGIGGWLAAVVTLGATTLILTAVVTIGALDAYRTKSAMAAGYRATMYELTSAVEEVDDGLERVRLATSPRLQAQLLTEILVQTRMAEVDLEKLPVSFEKDGNVMGFFNRTSMEAERLLGKLSSGYALSANDIATLEGLYKTNHAVRETLDELVATMEDKDFMDFMKGKDCRITDAIAKAENATVEDEDGTKNPKAMLPGGGDGVKPVPEAKKGGPKGGITSGQAEELCRRYFSEYGIASYEYAGELQSEGMEAYNFSMTDGEGVKLFAQIAKKNGALIRFDYYKECTQHTVDIRSAKALAEVFLEKLGYENMVAVDVEEEGTNAEFTFVYEMNGCVCYPDEVVVKVCEERGQVVGLDASDFLENHRTRDEVKPKISLEAAQEKLSNKLSVEATRLVLWEDDGRETLAYEFFCSMGSEYYFVYVDGMKGEEIAIVNAKNHDR